MPVASNRYARWIVSRCESTTGLELRCGGGIVPFHRIHHLRQRSDRRRQIQALLEMVLDQFGRDGRRGFVGLFDLLSN